MMILHTQDMVRSKYFSSIRIICGLGLGLIFYNEFLVYWIYYLNWPSLPKIASLNYPNTYKNKTQQLLLVADPQLIGENDEPWYYNWIARWDSDRYLRNTYVLANSYVKPDATLYLGDLFDEGLKSTDQQFKRYFKRFQSIFECDKMYKTHGIKQIFISGDNDIGGEYLGDRNDYLAERFEKYFGDTIEAIELSPNINLIKLDLDYTVSFYNKVKRNFVRRVYNELRLDQIEKSKKSNQTHLNDKLTIILNHMSILKKTKEELHAINKDTSATLVIKGDSHKFHLAKYNFLNNKIEESFDYLKNPSNFYIMNLHTEKKNQKLPILYELTIPTCSYRMGVPDMGYGMLTITPKGKAYVSILWLPSRYQCIYYYLIYLFCVSFYLSYKFFVKKAIYKCIRSIYKIFIPKIYLTL